jgi:O-6-methylguanine DNA methyltransferase
MLATTLQKIKSDFVPFLKKDAEHHPYIQRLQTDGYCHPSDLSGTSIWNLVAAPKTDFFRKVYECVVQIPPGETKTYAEVAADVGHPGAARAVGQAMARNNAPLLIPCHRVVASTGLGGYLYGLPAKEALLGLERKVFCESKIQK